MVLRSKPRAVRRAGGELAKAVIINAETGAAFPVMYNPDELKLEQGNTYAEVGIPGLDASPVQYIRGKARVLTMELLFDTLESGVDVREHTTPIARLLDKQPQTQAPPVLVFSFGRVQFRGVLVDASQRFTMFRRDGTPVRSTLSVRMQEYVEVDVEVRQGLFLGSPTLSAAVNAAVSATGGGPGAPAAHVTVVGDTLSGLAAAYLGDAGRWRELAQANGIQDPLNLRPGMTLAIPGSGPTTGRMP
jgi:hypothetical protein